jgi:hypothetical protein
MTTLQIRHTELNRMNGETEMTTQEVQSVTSSRECEFFLIHESKGLHGKFKRIVAGSNHKTHEEAGAAMARFGCLPNRPDHKIIRADEVTENHKFATFYSCYN